MEDNYKIFMRSVTLPALCWGLIPTPSVTRQKNKNIIIKKKETCNNKKFIVFTPFFIEIEDRRIS